MYIVNVYRLQYSNEMPVIGFDGKQQKNWIDSFLCGCSFEHDAIKLLREQYSTRKDDLSFEWLEVPAVLDTVIKLSTLGPVFLK